MNERIFDFVISDLCQFHRDAAGISQESGPSSLGTGLGTSKSMKAVRVPSEATPGKRDIAFDFISHNSTVFRLGLN